MFSTADLPETLRPADTDPDLLRAVRASGLRLDRCEHGRVDCPDCTILAAQALVGVAVALR